MTGIDMMAGKYSSVTPYNYAFNDPIGLNDPSGADPYLPRYREDRAARSAAQGGWGSGTIMDYGPIADPQRLAGSYYAAGRPELWGWDYDDGAHVNWERIRNIGGGSQSGGLLSKSTWTRSKVKVKYLAGGKKEKGGQGLWKKKYVRLGSGNSRGPAGWFAAEHAARAARQLSPWGALGGELAAGALQAGYEPGDGYGGSDRELFASLWIRTTDYKKARSVYKNAQKHLMGFLRDFIHSPAKSIVEEAIGLVAGHIRLERNFINEFSLNYYLPEGLTKEQVIEEFILPLQVEGKEILKNIGVDVAKEKIIDLWKLSRRANVILNIVELVSSPYPAGQDLDTAYREGLAGYLIYLAEFVYRP